MDRTFSKDLERNFEIGFASFRVSQKDTRVLGLKSRFVGPFWLAGGQAL